MSKLIAFVCSSLFVVSLSFAQTPTATTGAPAVTTASDCDTKAVSKTGKPLSGAAKASSIRKCEAAAKESPAPDSGCVAKAISKAGKPLVGAAKKAFLKKCEADFKAGK